MKWYDKLIQKLNPAQQSIADDEGSTVGSDAALIFSTAFDKVETVNRGTNMIVRAAAGLNYDVKDKVFEGVKVDMRQKTLLKLLNYKPNPYQSDQEFRINMFTDFILEGNVFLYFDGAYLYHLPAKNVEILTDTVTFVKGYRYDGRTDFKPDEIVHFKDLSNTSIYRGTSRLVSCTESILTMYKMQEFQKSFFENGAVPGLVFTTENTLGTAAKEKTIQYWMQKYNPRIAARRPMIVDSGLKPVPISQGNFKDLDFDVGIKQHNAKILNALGVPQVLFDGGNNANISPNLRLFYLETVLPIVRSFTSAMERYFGYDIEPITSSVSALQPELKELSSFLTSLVNGGILTPNEARAELRYEKMPGQDEIRIPANIAGSAVNPSLGGAPKNPKPEKEQQ
jgi:HK97 family phage portal protein